MYFLLFNLVHPVQKVAGDVHGIAFSFLEVSVEYKGFHCYLVEYVAKVGKFMD